MYNKTSAEIEMEIINRARKFCNKHALERSLTVIKKYAEIKMSQMEEYNWEAEVERNPYLLMQLDGVGFKKADKVAMGLGFPIDHKYRILAFVTKALDDISNGSTIIPMGDVLSYMGKELGIDDNSKIVNVVLNHSDGTYEMLDSSYKRTNDIMEARYLTQRSWYETERDFFNMLVKASKMPATQIDSEIKQKVISSMRFNLNNGQLKSVEMFDKFNINVLTGGGGVGKTTVVEVFLKCLLKSKQTFTCLTPTGIASKVFTSSTGFDSRTIHSYYFRKGSIDTDWVILDECSMHSLDHIKMILRMIDKDCPPRFLFIGDVGQLQPIGNGDVFNSVINLIKNNRIKGNIMELTQIMRASDETFIPHLSQQFRGDNKYDSSCENRTDLANVYFYKLESDLPKQLLNVIGTHKMDFKSTYILIPQNIGDIGNVAVNDIIDGVIATNNILYKDKYRTFRQGTELMHTKNNDDLNIYNGERITLTDRVNDNFICTKVDTGEEIVYDEETFKTEVIKSYGCTVHKMQGITSENIILVVSAKHKYMLTRNLVYTGMSRASKKLIILYDDGMLSYAHSRVETNKRLTFLGLLAKRR